MAKPKNVTIKLTAKQRYELKRLTGADHDEVMFEAVTPKAGVVASRAILTGKSAPKKGLHLSAPRPLKLGRPRPMNVTKPRTLNVNKPRAGFNVSKPRTIVGKGD